MSQAQYGGESIIPYLHMKCITLFSAHSIKWHIYFVGGRLTFRVGSFCQVSVTTYSFVYSSLPFFLLGLQKVYVYVHIESTRLSRVQKKKFAKLKYDTASIAFGAEQTDFVSVWLRKPMIQVASTCGFVEWNGIKIITTASVLNDFWLYDVCFGFVFCLILALSVHIIWKPVSGSKRTRKSISGHSVSRVLHVYPDDRWLWRKSR